MQTEDTEALFHQLENFRTSRQWKRVREVTGKLLTHEPSSDYLHYLMGHALLQLNELESAEKHLKKAISLNPENDSAYQTLAYTYWQMGRLGVAEDHARKAISLDPDDEEHWFLMAYLCLQFEDYKQAFFCAEKAGALVPEDSRLIDIRTQAGGMATGKEKLPPQEQIKRFTEILKKNPEDDYTHAQIGCVYFNDLKDYAKAEEHFRRALSLDPEDKTNQALLLKALRKRDLILRLLWAPFDFAALGLKVFEWAWEKKWPLIFLIPVAKFIIVPAMALMLIFFTLFWPMAKVYEWLTIVEAHKKMGKITLYRGPFARIHRLSFPVRCSLFAGIFVIFWSFILWFASREGNQAPILGWVFSLTALGVGALAIYGWSSTILEYFRKKRRNKKNKVINQPKTAQ